MSVLENIEGLRDARNKKKLSQATLSFRSRVEQGDISRYENGEKSMGQDAAEKLARVVGSNPVTLQFHNRAHRLVKARERNDAEGVFQAAKSAVKLLDGLEMDSDDEKALDELVEAAIAFAKTLGGSKVREVASTANKSVADPYMSGLANESRDLTGRKVENNDTLPYT